MDFKWTLSRPGIELEFETGSIREAIGILEQDGSQISEVFGFTMGVPAAAPAAEPEPKTRKSRKGADPATAVAPDPLPVPSEAAPVPPLLVAPVAPTTATLPPNAFTGHPGVPAPALVIPADGGIPPFLQREAAPALAALPSPPLAPTPPPVGVLGPKVVAALDIHKLGKADGGQALADWLATAGLTIKGASYDDACRVVLMTSDEKLKGVAERLGVQ